MEEIRKVTFEVLAEGEQKQWSFSLEIPENMTRDELHSNIEKCLQLPSNKVFALRQSINRTLFSTQLLLTDKSIGCCQIQIATKESKQLTLICNSDRVRG